MNEHQAFKTPLIPVIMMITGLNYLFANLWLSALVGIAIYAAAVGMEQFFSRK